MKKVIFALALGMLIGSSVTAIAANVPKIGDKVTAVYSTFNFVVNGKKKELNSLPVVINGSSYLPVRAVADLFDHNVDYISETSTVVLTTKPVERGDSAVNSPLEQPKLSNDEQQPLTIEGIESEIKRLKTRIKANLTFIEFSYTDEEKKKYQDENTDMEKQILDLESQKSELENQSDEKK